MLYVVLLDKTTVTSHKYMVLLMAVVALLISRTNCCSPGPEVLITCLLLETFSHRIDCTVKLLEQVTLTDEPSTYTLLFPEIRISEALDVHIALKYL